MFRNYALISLTLAFAAMGCSKDEGNKSSDKKLQDLTDTSSCHGNPPSNASIYNTWTGKFAANGKAAQISFTFTQGYATVSMTCDNGETGTASSRAVITGDQVQILEKNRGGTQNCPMNTQPTTLSYTLIGNCVQLSDGKETHLLVNATGGLNAMGSGSPQGPSGSGMVPPGNQWQSSGPEVFIEHQNEELPSEE